MSNVWGFNRAGGMSYWLTKTYTEGVRTITRTVAEIGFTNQKDMEAIVDTLNQGEELLREKANAERERKKGQGNTLGNEAGEPAGGSGAEVKTIPSKRRKKRVQATGS